ncbi:MAG: hypothetical protein H6567_11055 [Lewinellaceae bacterium]|nr:hypothetical protein [Lewinellaceae bacterium]
MKNSIFLRSFNALYFLFAAGLTMHAQSASVGLNMDEFKPSKENVFVDNNEPYHGDPIGSWPKCGKPILGSYAIVKDSIIITWEYTKEDANSSDIELAISDRSHVRNENSVFLKSNRYSIKIPTSFNEKETEIKIRRRCFLPDGDYFFSDWVFPSAAPIVPCDGGTIGYDTIVCDITNIPIINNLNYGSDSTNYQWEKSAGNGGTNFISINGANNAFYQPPPQAGMVTYRRKNNCGSISNTVLYQFPSTDFAISGQNSLCLGETIQLSVVYNPDISYLWNTGATTNVINVSPSVNTNYTVSITYQNSPCTLEKSKLITLKPVIQAFSASVGNCMDSSNSNDYYYSVYYSITFENAYTGNIHLDINGNQRSTINVNVVAGQTINGSKVIKSNGVSINSLRITDPFGTLHCGNASVEITNPCLTQCQYSNVSFGPYTDCVAGHFDIPFSFNFETNGTGFTEVYVSYANHTFTLAADSSHNYNGVLTNIPIGSSGDISISTNSTPSCDYNYSSFVPPSTCDNPPSNECSVSYVSGFCDGGTYTLTATALIADPVTNTTFEVKYDGQYMTYYTVLPGQTVYTIEITGLMPDGQMHTISIEGASCQNIATDEFYAPASCGSGYDCHITANYDVSECNVTNNRYSIEISGYAFCLPDVVTISDPTSGQEVSVNPNSDGFFVGVLENLPSDGETHTIDILSELNGLTGVIYTAPEICSNVPSFQCGDPYNQPNNFSEKPLERLEIGETFKAAGLPIIVDEVEGANGVFSGNGYLPTPFYHKKLKVHFSNISINEDYQMFGGEVLGVSSGFVLNDVLPLDTFSIGGDICIVAPAPEGYDSDGFSLVTGLNDRGFGRDSLYYPDGTKYDPNGYDFNGIHEDTGTPYDNFGCDMNDLNADGQPCFRDSTLVKIRDSIYNNIVPTKLDGLIGSNLNNLLDSLASFDCDAIRTEMNAKITALGYDAKYIKGESNQYFNEGLSEHFASEPKPLILNSGRLEDAKVLEKKHIELYKCDKLSTLLNEMVKELQNVDKQKLAKYIKDQLTTLNKTDLQRLLDDPDELEKWVLSAITSYLENKVGESIGMDESSEPRKPSTYEPPAKIHREKSAYFNVASTDDDPFKYDFTPKPGEEEAWLYNQGFKVIKGVNRGYYLEEAYRQYQQQQLLGGEDDYVLQPILLTKDTSGIKYNIYIDQIKLTPTNASLDAYFIFKVPSTDKKLAMYAQNLNWGSGGLIGESSLHLGSAIEMRLSNSALLRLNASTPGSTNGTYVTWDCSGFQSITIDADVELCREFVTPLDPETLQPLAGDERFSVKVKTTLYDWSDFYFSISANKAFAITKYPTYKWKLTGLTIDMSDHRSPSGNMFPDYQSKNYSNGFTNEWRGFYLEELSVTFPNDFSNGSAPLTVGVQNFVIDDSGVSGTAFVSNLVPIETGNLGGWPFSVDTLKITVLQNHLNGGGLNGRIKVPVFNSPMRYAATMFPDNKYEFSISTTGKQEMDMLLADVTLDSLCSVKVLYDNGEVVAKASLTGEMTIGAFGNSKFSLPAMRFENFEVSNKAPYFSPGTWKIKDTISTGNLAGFELSINKIEAIKKSDTEAGVSLDVGVSLALKMKASGGFDVIGELTTDDEGRQKWVHKYTKVNKFGIDADFSGGHITGYLETFDGNNKYGEGFHGLVKLKVNTLGEFQAMGLFGKTSFKYFFVDAAIELNTGIPVGPLEMNGFIGGVSYRMNVTTDGSVAPPTMNSNSLPALGKSFTGNIYLPDESKGLGLRAGVKIRMAKNAKIFNGSILFEILFNADKPDGSGGGVANITLDGKGQLMNLSAISGELKLSEGLKPSGVSGSLSAHIRFTYDFNENIFSGKLVAFLSAGALKGAGGGGKMVDAEIYVSSSKWYFYFGTPAHPCGIALNTNILKVTLSAYMCIGTEIPGLPAVPADVVAIAGDIKPNRAFANSGNGFLFGASFDIQAKINVLGLASAEMQAKAGFDVMIRDFGDNATCAGRSGTVGIDGWYATGQLWALISGKLKLLGFTIFDAGIAGIMQAQFPNPFYAQATFGITIKTFLGKVNKKLKMEFGDQCIIQSDNPGLGIKIIASVLPGDGAKKLPSDILPVVSFNVPITTLDIGDKFDLSIASVSIQSLKNGYTYPVTQIFSDDFSTLTVKPRDLYYANDSIRFTVKVKVVKNGGQPTYEEESVIFTTGEVYQTIPLANVEYSYPVHSMNNFYRGEYSYQQGYIQLKFGMPHLFYNLPEGVSQKIRLTPKNGDPLIYDFTYDGLNARIVFPLGMEQLKNETHYKLELVRFDSNVSNNTNPNEGVDVSTLANNMNFGNMLSGSGTQNNSSSSSGNESILFDLSFRTSKYNSMTTKFYSLTKQGDVYVTDEPWDHIEFGQLMDVSINITGWLNDPISRMYPYDGIIYANYPVQNIKVDTRQEINDDLKVFSVWGTTMKNIFRTKLKNDAAKIKSTVASYFTSEQSTNSYLSYLMMSFINQPGFFDQPMTVKFSYTLPGGITTYRNSLNF